MPRAPRIEFAGAVYHVMARGNRREPIVFDDEDRQLFVDTLARACEMTGWEIFAWVLMDNHYHLVMRTPKANLVAGMKWLQNAYTRRLNTKRQLWGHLFGGRYRSLLVEDTGRDRGPLGDYLTTVIDYVHLNPGRAGLVDGRQVSVRDYAWSSLSQGYVRAPGKRPEWLRAEAGLQALDLPDTVSGRRRLVTRLDAWIREERFGSEIDGTGIAERIRRGWFWGTEKFRERMLKRLEKKGKGNNRNYQSSATLKDHQQRCARRILAAAQKHFGLTAKELKQPVRGDLTRAAIAWKVARHTTLPRAWLVDALNLKSSANASRVVRNFDQLPDRRLNATMRKWKELRIVD